MAMALMVWAEVTEEEETDTAVAPATKVKNATARAPLHQAVSMNTRANIPKARTQEHQVEKDASMDVVVPEALVDVEATAMDLAEDISGAMPVVEDTASMAIKDHAVHPVVLLEALVEHHSICLDYSQV